MKILVTGSAGHLGEGLMRTLQKMNADVVGVDIKPSAYTTHVGSIVDRDFVRRVTAGVSTIFHTATLHKPHVATHTMQQFVDTNISGTLNLLEEAVAAGAKRFIFTSTTSVFGDALVPPGNEPAAWIDENVKPIPKNIYGVTKAAAENLCQLFHRNHKLPCIILRTSRFFPEEDDNAEMRKNYSDQNTKANEFLFRRIDVEDVVSAHIVASEKVVELKFGTYIISATSPFSSPDCAALRIDAPSVVKKYVPEFENVYQQKGWKMFSSIDRVYDNTLARTELGWNPVYDFKSIVRQLANGKDVRSPLAQAIGSKGYHPEKFRDGPYPV